MYGNRAYEAFRTSIRAQSEFLFRCYSDPKDKTTGERKERTEWHRVSIMNDGLVTVAEKYLKKGAKVYIEGKLETRKWTDKDGQEKYSTEIVLRPYHGELIMLDGKNQLGDAVPPDEQAAA